MFGEEQTPVDSGKCIQQEKKNYLRHNEIAAHVRHGTICIQSHFSCHRRRSEAPKAIADRAAKEKRHSDELQVHGRETVGYKQII
jgi:hypothetical protein